MPQPSKSFGNKVPKNWKIRDFPNSLKALLSTKPQESFAFY